MFSPTGAGGGGGWATSIHSDCMCVRICVGVRGATGDYIMRTYSTALSVEEGGWEKVLGESPRGHRSRVDCNISRSIYTAL